MWVFFFPGVSSSWKGDLYGFLTFLTTIESGGSADWKDHTKEIKCHFSLYTEMTPCRFCFCYHSLWHWCVIKLLLQSAGTSGSSSKSGTAAQGNKDVVYRSNQEGRGKGQSMWVSSSWAISGMAALRPSAFFRSLFGKHSRKECFFLSFFQMDESTCISGNLWLIQGCKLSCEIRCHYIGFAPGFIT